MSYPDASGVPVNQLPARDASAFDQLKQLVDSEPIGIENVDLRKAGAFRPPEPWPGV